MKNTIILRKGYAHLTKREFDKFKKLDTIMGIDSNPEELQRWSIGEEDKALAELRKYRCSYDNGVVEEYALEYCMCDAEGIFQWGSDYTPAPTEVSLTAIRKFPEFGKTGKYRLQYTQMWGRPCYILYGEFPEAEEKEILEFYEDEIDEEDPDEFWEKVDEFIADELGFDADYDLYV